MGMQTFLGSGDFKPDPDTESCPPAARFGIPSSQGESQYYSAYFNEDFFVDVSASGNVEQSKHRQLALGRPAGQCAADIGVRVHGRVLASNLIVQTLGQCCDHCNSYTRCAAWNFERSNCTLIDTDDSYIRRENRQGSYS